MNRRTIELLYWITGIVASLAAIIGTYLLCLQFIKTRVPCLQAVVDCGRWRAPFYVEEELRGMEKVSHACEGFRVVMPDDDTLKKVFPKVHEFSSEIISEIERLEPCEANNVAHLKSIYSIMVTNDSGKVCEDVKIIFKDAKYIEFEKEGEERQKFQDRILVKMGDLDSSTTIEIDVWATCPVIGEPEFKITSRGQPADVHFN